MTGVASQARLLLTAELRTELRGRHTLWTGVPYAAAGLLVIAIAVGADIALLRRIGTGTFWALILLFGSLVSARQTSIEAPRRELFTLLGVDPAVLFLARAGAASLLVLGFELLLAPIAVALYDLRPARLAALAAAALLVAVGIGVLGTLAADLVSSPRAPIALVPLIVTPLAVPLVLTAVQIQLGSAGGASAGPWLVLALTADLVLVVAGLLSARPLGEVDP